MGVRDRRLSTSPNPRLTGLLPKSSLTLCLIRDCIVWSDKNDTKQSRCLAHDPLRSDPEIPSRMSQQMTIQRPLRT